MENYSFVNDPKNQAVAAPYRPMSPAAYGGPWPAMPADDEEGDDLGRRGPGVMTLARKYWPLGIALLVVGVSAGFAITVLTKPVYRASVLLEMQEINRSFFKNTLESSAFEVDGAVIQTQIRLLQGEQFLGGIADRLKSETVPPAPARDDIFSKIRARVYASSQDPMSMLDEAIGVALSKMIVRPINGTRLIEITSESTSPEVAANFVNTVAAEYVESNTQSRNQNAQKTAQWVTGQLEEAKIRYQESEKRLQDFVRTQGVMFAAPDQATLAETKLRELQGQLSVIQSDRIGKQTRYEMATKNPAETLPDVLDDPGLRMLQSRVAELRREKAALMTTLTEEHYKVKRIQAQIDEVDKTLKTEVSNVVSRIKNEYDTAQRKERLLSGAYGGQAGTVVAQADKAAQFNMLKREVEIAKAEHNALLVQASQVGMTNSVPVSTIRLVGRTSPPKLPYKPNPWMNLAFGGIGGIAVSVAIVFIRETRDRSVRGPGGLPAGLQTRELGVIPSVEAVLASDRRLFSKRGTGLPPLEEKRFSWPNISPALVAWSDRPSALTESFRVTVASLLRGTPNGSPPQIFAVTSPGIGEGKTTFASNIAIALAETGRRVLVVDTDFRRPRLHEIFQVASDWGLQSILQSKFPIEDIPEEELFVATKIPGVSVLPSGPLPDNIQRVIHSPLLPRLFSRLREHFDAIVLDTPPLLMFADARVLSRWSDGVVLVVRSGKTDLADIADSRRQLQEDGTHVLGTVLNDWRPEGRASQHSRYYRQYTQEND